VLEDYDGLLWRRRANPYVLAKAELVASRVSQLAGLGAMTDKQYEDEQALVRVLVEFAELIRERSKQ